MKKELSKENKEQLAFWKRCCIKGFVTFGFTFFSVVTTLGFSNAFQPAVVAGGVYIFAEAIKYYNIEPDKKVLSKKGTYMFLI